MRPREQMGLGECEPAKRSRPGGTEGLANEISLLSKTPGPSLLTPPKVIK